MHRAPFRLFGLALVLFVTLFATVSAQGGNSLAAYSISAGGGVSSGEGLTLDSVVAQSIAGIATGGGMTLLVGIADLVPAGQPTAQPTSQPTATPYRNWLPTVGN